MDRLLKHDSYNDYNDHYSSSDRLMDRLLKHVAVPRSDGESSSSDRLMDRLLKHFSTNTLISESVRVTV